MDEIDIIYYYGDRDSDSLPDHNDEAGPGGIEETQNNLKISQLQSINNIKLSLYSKERFKILLKIST